jgi:hypothetical protein
LTLTFAGRGFAGAGGAADDWAALDPGAANAALEGSCEGLEGVDDGGALAFDAVVESFFAGAASEAGATGARGAGELPAFAAALARLLELVVLVPAADFARCV